MNPSREEDLFELALEKPAPEFAFNGASDREGTVYWLAWHPREPRLAIARDNGDIALWDLAKLDRHLAELGLGFTPAPAEYPPTQDKP